MNNQIRTNLFIGGPRDCHVNHIPYVGLKYHKLEYYADKDVTHTYYQIAHTLIKADIDNVSILAKEIDLRVYVYTGES